MHNRGPRNQRRETENSVESLRWEAEDGDEDGKNRMGSRGWKLEDRKGRI